MPLVAECEFSNKMVAGIVEDFQKLLVARAGVRLMIHEYWTDREEITDPACMANHLAELIQYFNHTQTGDLYLLAALGFDHDIKVQVQVFQAWNGRRGCREGRVRPMSVGGE